MVKQDRTLIAANKVTYMTQMYPDLTAEKIISLMQVPPVETNAAIWKAQELGWLGKDIVDEKIVIKKLPTKWEFGEMEETIEETILFCFKHLASDETDLDEKFMTDWLMGYPAHDTLIAVNHLVETGKLAEYELTDDDKKLGKSVYKFYTLKENLGKQWGQKNFKNPVTPTTPEEHEEATKVIKGE